MEKWFKKWYGALEKQKWRSIYRTMGKRESVRLWNTHNITGTKILRQFC